jgi:hypothetical protein
MDSVTDSRTEADLADLSRLCMCSRGLQSTAGEMGEHDYDGK